MPSLDAYCEERLTALDAAQLRRRLRAPIPLLSFADNDYLDLRQHTRVVAAAQAALAVAGAGAGASRLVSGNHDFYAPLEAKLAAMKGAEAALVFGSGYLTNLGVIPALVGKSDVIFADKLVHACIIDAAQLSGARLLRFRHNDMAHLEALLKAHRDESERALIVTDHVFSMDGDVAPLAAIVALAKHYDAWTMADDAHGLGLVEAAATLDVWMGTLSKAAGSYGGYVTGSRALIELLLNDARSFVFSTGLPPAVCAASIAALEVMEAEPELSARALSNAQRVTAALGLPPAQSAIVPILCGAPEKALATAEALAARGIHAAPIRPPTVPAGTARIRLAFSARHTEEQVAQLIAALKEIL